MSKLYLVPTPIGNLEDITIRALNVLKTVDCIACEDTRNSGLLLSKLGINAKKLISIHSYNEEKSINGVIKLLDDKKDIALVTDAGTPCISDPGARVVEAIKTTNHSIIPLPGANAASTIISAAGNIGKTWGFEGFLPKTPNKLRKRIKELMEQSIAWVIYESPFRITKLLSIICEIDKERRVTIGRELTKMHEEILTDSALNLCNDFLSRAQIKGEFALVIHPANIKDIKNENVDI